MTAVAQRPVAAVPGLRRRRFAGLAWTAVTLAAGLAVWAAVAWWYGPTLTASPADTLRAGIDLAEDGSLGASILASARRILSGWALGVLVGAPVGILMGRVTAIRRLLDPYIEFFRFIPPIAFVTLAIVWFGIGETSKIILIFYTSVFLVTVNTIAGVLAIDESKLRAATSLGANRRQLLHAVVLPATIPYIITGARLAMGNSFLTIVSAEIVAADTGLGALIWQARNYGRIDWIFVGIIALGLLGYTCDRLIRLLAGRLLRRYGVKV
ncbi:ABC transporter permease [Actinoplanes sp. OR16]|uniref:ABC transporter permease n=1 Tax=Actinoplanes sp. OR16 TaxID=946334 RepID=UPI000F6C3506|nr:ABC transporter permease [Actinoplanes sp. OR16]BBH67901.1 ABC transporter permease [Actinoplanes sp. OR16]